MIFPHFNKWRHFSLNILFHVSLSQFNHHNFITNMTIKIIIQGQLLLLKHFLLNSSNNLNKKRNRIHQKHIKYLNYYMLVLYSIQNLSVTKSSDSASHVSWNANATIREAGAPKGCCWENTELGGTYHRQLVPALPPNHRQTTKVLSSSNILSLLV